MEQNKFSNFFANKCIFISGCTGSVGIALVEKLLRSFPDIQCLILLIRKSRNNAALKRTTTYFNNPFFSVMRRTHKEYLNKVVWIEGNINEPNLGLAEKDMDYIWDNVNVIYHCAASVYFDENLKTISRTNLWGTEELYKLAKQCKNLQCFMYVSTLFSNNKYSQFESKEIVYENQIDPKEFLEMCNTLSAKDLELECKKLFKDFPNNYVLSKNITENLMNQKKDNIKIGIFRVSAVTESYREPFPGALINENVLTMLLRNLHTGITIKFDPKIPCTISPIDLSTNALIAAAFDTAHMEGNLKVYNMSGKQPPFIDFYKLFLRNFNDKWLIFGGLKYRFLSHMKDLVLEMSGKRGIYVKKIEKLEKAIESCVNFAMKPMTYPSDNLDNLWKAMNQAERNMLYFNLADVDYPRYVKNMFELNTDKFVDVMDIRPTMLQLAKL